MKQTEILTRATHVNGMEPAVYMSCMSQNYRLFHVSNLSVRNFRIFLLMYPGSVRRHSWVTCRGSRLRPAPGCLLGHAEKPRTACDDSTQPVTRWTYARRNLRDGLLPFMAQSVESAARDRVTLCRRILQLRSSRTSE